MREFIKSATLLFIKLICLPIWGSYIILSFWIAKDGLSAGYSQFLSLIPGTLGVYCRKACCNTLFEKCEPSSFIGFGVLFSHFETIIDEDVYIGPQSNVGKCHIERNCLLGSAVHIMSGKRQHNFAQIDVPLKDQGGTFERITIGENSWLGNGALVMANIGKHCIIAAGSVVTEPVPDFSIAAGNPAKVIKSRT